MFGRRSDDDLQRRVNALEREVAELRSRLDAVARSGDGVPGGASPWPVVPAGNTAGEVSSSVMHALRQGRKIEAIKLYRQEYGVGLKEAKDAVEQLG